MRKVNFKKSFNVLLEYMMVFNIIFSCNSVFQHDLQHNHMYLLKATVLASILFLLKLNQNNIKKIQYIKIILFLLFYFIYLLTFYFLNVSIEQSHRFLVWFGVIIPIFLLCFWSYNNSGMSIRLLKVYSNILIILSIISIIFWISCSILSIIPLNTDLLVGWGRSNYIYGFSNIYYETQSINFLFFNCIRNTGIFIEAPMYSFCLSLALIIELFVFNSINRKNIIILIITIMTTVSTTGMGCVLLSLGLKYILNRDMYSKEKRIIRFCVSFILIIIILFVLNIIIINKSSTHSFSVRISDLLTEFEIWKNNFLIGSGFNTNQYGSSDSIMVILADGGIFLGVFYLIPFMILWKNKFKEFSIVLLMIFSFTVVPYTGLTFFVLAYIYSLYICKNEFKIVSELRKE